MFQKRQGEMFSYHINVISRIRCNFWQSLKECILYMGFRATLNFRKFKVALKPMYRIVPQVTSYPAYQNSIIKKIHRAVSPSSYPASSFPLTSGRKRTTLESEVRKYRTSG